MSSPLIYYVKLNNNKKFVTMKHQIYKQTGMKSILNIIQKASDVFISPHLRLILSTNEVDVFRQIVHFVRLL